MIECTNNNILKKKHKLKFKGKKFIIFLLIVVCVFLYSKFFVQKNIYNYCSEYAEKISFDCINKVIDTTLYEQIKFQDLFDIQKNNENEIVFMGANSLKINYLQRKIVNLSTIELQNELNKGISIPFMAFSGINYLSNLGKSVRLYILNVSKIDCDFSSEFSSAGLNQTKHSFYLTYTSKVNLNIPLNNREIIYNTKILINESIIVGEVPGLLLNK